MSDNEFDMNFDINDADFDTDAFLNSQEFDENIDLSEFADEDPDLSADEGFDEEFEPEADGDFDLGSDLDLLLDMDRDEPADEETEYDPQEPVYPDDDPMEDSDEVPEEEEEEEEPTSRRRKKEKSFKVNVPKLTMPKITMPKFMGRFFALYFAPLTDKEMREYPADPNNTRRRRKKPRNVVFKEIYLPPIIACVSMILVLSFVVGSLSNLIERKRIESERNQSHLASSESAAQVEEQRIAQMVSVAEAYAVGYDYDKAIAALDSVGDLSAYPDLAAKKTEYVNAQSQLTEFKDASLIPNLSFNLLIEDLNRAKADKDYGGLYNKNFVSTGEFRKILEQLYSNGYVLVDFDSFTGSNTDTSGVQMFMDVPIQLPAGKKPIMITETLVNYFNYMIDGNGDNVADAQGAGFASKLVLQNGEIKAEYVDTTGAVQVGDYDLVPILETFIKEHPDFSYRGARAILAVTGYEGIFGYRITSDYIASKGQDYVNQEIADCKILVQALRDKGYTIACNTFRNKPYGQMSVAEISADLQSWATQIVPVTGPVDVMVFVKNSPISNYNDAAFQALYSNGFRYFVAESASPWAEINKTYVRQNRIIVSGNTMAWKTTNFTTPTMIFDPPAVLDISTRGQVPN